MGFGSFKDKFKKATGLSTTTLLTGGLFGGTGAGGLIAAHLGGLDFAGSLDITGAKAAAKAQIEALRAAGRKEEAQRLEAELFRQQILSETAPFREQGRTELARLQAQRPGETEFFRQGLERGTEAIAERAAGFGLLDSGSTRRGFGELGAQLLSQEELRRQQGLQSAAQLSQLGFGTGLGALQQQGAAAARRAQTEANIGALQAQSKVANRQFLLGAGTQLLGLGAGALLGGPLGAAAGGAAGSAAGTQGGYTLQPPQFNQFQQRPLGFNSFQPQFP
jgi:hypothetical protein